jgi:hypothetical protein
MNWRKGAAALTGLLTAIVLLIGAVGSVADATVAPCVGCNGRLAFVKTGRSADQVWVSDLAGRHATQLGPGDTPLVSPSGGIVAAGLNGKGAALAVYGPGLVVHKFFDTNRVGTQPIAWSADSRYIAIELFGDNPGKHDHDSGLAVIDTQTFKAKTIAKGSICGASFSPALPDRLAYGLGPAGTFCLSGDVNVSTANPDGSARKRITSDGRSLNPVWGPTKIAFDRERLRRGDAPVYQLWLMDPEGHARKQLTHTKVPTLLDGLVPVQFSTDGKRLLAGYVGQDTNETWTVQVTNGRTRQLTVRGVSVTAGGMSRDGSTVLVDYNGFLNPPSAGTVETVPFTGGRATVLVRRAGFPSWNR